MTSTHELIWEKCLSIIRDIVEWQPFKTWFEPIKPVKLVENVLTIQVPSQFFYEYLEEHYVGLLGKTIKRELGKDARLEYRIVVDGASGHTNPVTINMPTSFNRPRSESDVNFPLVINNPVKNPYYFFKKDGKQWCSFSLIRESEYLKKLLKKKI